MLLKLGEYDPAGSEEKESNRQQRVHPNHVQTREKEDDKGDRKSWRLKGLTETYTEKLPAWSRCRIKPLLWAHLCWRSHEYGREKIGGMTAGSQASHSRYRFTVQGCKTCKATFAPRRKR